MLVNGKIHNMLLSNSECKISHDALVKSTSRGALRLPEDQKDLQVFHQPLGVSATAWEIITEQLKRRAIFLLALLPSSPVHPLRPDCQLIWSMIWMRQEELQLMHE